jgi:hypothetical protein
VNKSEAGKTPSSYFTDAVAAVRLGDGTDASAAAAAIGQYKSDQVFADRLRRQLVTATAATTPPTPGNASVELAAAFTIGEKVLTSATAAATTAAVGAREFCTAALAVLTQCTNGMAAGKTAAAAPPPGLVTLAVAALSALSNVVAITNGGGDGTVDAAASSPGSAIVAAGLVCLCNGVAVLLDPQQRPSVVAATLQSCTILADRLGEDPAGGMDAYRAMIRVGLVSALCHQLDTDAENPTFQAAASADVLMLPAAGRSGGVGAPVEVLQTKGQHVLHALGSVLHLTSEVGDDPIFPYECSPTNTSTSTSAACSSELLEVGSALRGGLATKMNEHPQLHTMLLAVLFASLQRSGSSYALQVLLHLVRHHSPSAKLICSTQQYVATLGGLLFETDTEVLTMVLLAFEAVLAGSDCKLGSEVAGFDSLDMEVLGRIFAEYSVPNAAAAALVIASPLVFPTRAACFVEGGTDDELAQLALSLLDEPVLEEGREFVLRQGAGFDLKLVSLLEGPLKLLRTCVEASTGTAALVREPANWNRLGAVLMLAGGDWSHTASTSTTSPSPTHASSAHTPSHQPTATTTSPLLHLLSPNAVMDLLVSFFRLTASASDDPSDPNGQAALPFDRAWAEAVIQPLRQHHLRLLMANWPESRGGGHTGTAALIATVSNLLRLPLWERAGRDRTDVAEFMAVLEELEVLQVLLMLSATFLSSSLVALRAPLGLISTLVVTNSSLTNQFVQCISSMGADGAKLLLLALTLPRHPNAEEVEVVAKMTAVVAHLARISKVHYSFLDAAGVLTPICRLLSCANPTVQAKACSALGNLFRHSALFYTPFSRASGAVDDLLNCLDDPDPDTCKFAAFAVGNLGFHSDQFYNAISRAIGPLLSIMEGSSFKARANAAGALGNLGRNSALLDPELSLQRAPQRIAALALTEAKQDTLAQACLHSLGTLAKRSRCKTALQEASGLREQLTGFPSQSAATKKQLARLLARF